MSLLKKRSNVQKLNDDQKIVFEKLTTSNANVFLTGPAGVGKSYVLQRYIETKKETIPILASTGAAAVQIGGRTFHSFFGLGIMEGGLSRTIERAAKSDRVLKRLNKTKEIIIDEISMIHPDAFVAANEISKLIRKNDEPFGGIRIILLGDFLQLPPVDRFEKKIPWLFSSLVWNQLCLETVELHQSMRTESQYFVDILNKIRFGVADYEVEQFLSSRSTPLKDDFQGTVLFGRRTDADVFNREKLNKIKKPLQEFTTEVLITAKTQTPIETILKYSPIAEVLTLKEGALVMIRKNDVNDEYVNGSLGKVQKISPDELVIKLLSGNTVYLEKEEFQVLDGDGKAIATLRNFPVSLGWATTIHKSQGASIDSLHVNLKGLWEYGQAYVALSRAKDPEQLFIEDWTRGSIKADPTVVKFYDNNF